MLAISASGGELLELMLERIETLPCLAELASAVRQRYRQIRAASVMRASASDGVAGAPG